MTSNSSCSQDRRSLQVMSHLNSASPWQCELICKGMAFSKWTLTMTSPTYHGHLQGFMQMLEQSLWRKDRWCDTTPDTHDTRWETAWPIFSFWQPITLNSSVRSQDRRSSRICLSMILKKSCHHGISSIYHRTFWVDNFKIVINDQF